MKVLYFPHKKAWLERAFYYLETKKLLKVKYSAPLMKQYFSFLFKVSYF